jgi:hypothetical protein
VKVYNVHHLATTNLGDLNAAVSKYFDLGCEVRDIWADPPEPESAVIYGGGGLLHECYQGIIRDRALIPWAKTILWGIGTNTHGVEDDPYPDWIDNCFVGMRDYGTKYRWVPCASCMSPLFDVKREPSCKVVVYRHARDSVLPSINAPTMENVIEDAASAEVGLERALNFLGSGHYVVTDTYHGAYWATLLGRKVILYPFATRHRKFKHKPSMLERHQDWREGRPMAKVYPEALEECREANRRFFCDVTRFIKESQ